MKGRSLISLIILFAISKGYGQQKVGGYLNQPPPGLTAVLFAKGIVSSDSLEHSAPAFSPDGSTVLWTVIHRFKPSFLLESRNIKGKWTKPARPSFSDSTADDFYPSFSNDGKKLFFSSRRKTDLGYQQGLRIWEVLYENGRWGKPLALDSAVSQGEDYAHSVTKRGDLYFSFRRNGGKVFDIAWAKRVGNKYLKPQVLKDGVSTEYYEDGPFVSPDGSYLIFESNRPDGMEGSIDLYISFRMRGGKWSTPKNMGPKVNSKYAERFARVSQDGKYLFFGSSRSGIMDIYWIDARVIDELKPD